MKKKLAFLMGVCSLLALSFSTAIASTQVPVDEIPVEPVEIVEVEIPSLRLIPRYDFGAFGAIKAGTNLRWEPCLKSQSVGYVNKGELVRGDMELPLVVMGNCSKSIHPDCYTTGGWVSVWTKDGRVGCVQDYRVDWDTARYKPLW